MNENSPIQEKDLATREAQKRVDKIKKFYKSLTSWAGTSFFLIALDLFMSHGITWSKFPVFFWGIAVAMQFFDILRLQRMDKNWEDRMLKKQLDRQALPNSNPSETEDYSDDLLRRGDQPEKEKADLSSFRKLKKPWKDEDLV
ncbi:MAG: 2TM domain-containing protein [Saprospiraceae bacterium]|uniref:2TM domain-containing protein n=1 Tax=Candidatus Opimibacter skivensis TaxID=2982028 RepID=A0A9D7SY64_9BACT|nr:2TM domain-containing protein [Candidatus Opimibacter skivensis]